MTRPRLDAAALAFVALGVIWGSNFLFMKWASETLTPSQVAFGRVLCGFVPLLGYSLAMRSLRWHHLRHAHHILVMALLATSLYYAAFAAGTARLPSGIAGALSGAIPLFSFLGAILFLRQERITRAKTVGVVLGFAGVLLIARPWQQSGAVDPVGVGLMLLGSASVGLSFVYARRFVSDLGIPASALTTYQMAIAVLALGVVTDLDGITAIRDDPRGLLGLVLGLGLLGTGVAYILYYLIVARLGAVTASSATYIPPAVALLIGWAVAGESVDLQDLVALGLILSGVLLLRTRPVRTKVPVPTSG